MKSNESNIVNEASNVSLPESVTVTTPKESEVRVAEVPATTGIESKSILERYNLTTESQKAVRLNAPRTGKNSSTHRGYHIRSIQKYADEIIKDCGGRLWISAQEVLVGLLKRGCGLTVRGVPMKDCKALGDALGGHGLNLPYIYAGTTRYYALAMANATPEEIEAAHAQLKEEAVAAVKVA